MGPEYGASCLECDWTWSGEGSDRAAEKHGREAGHSTRSWMTP